MGMFISCEVRAHRDIVFKNRVALRNELLFPTSPIERI